MAEATSDTIVAPATGAGEAPIAVVRVSGPDAERLLNTLLNRSGAGDDTEFESHRLYYGTIASPDGTPLDEVLAALMRGPRSFTGEDVAEIYCHGGSAVVSAILDACLAGGARLAQPGEFSQRAFMNGRIDLAQAEAISDLIRARTDLGRRIALQQLRGGLSQRVTEIRAGLIEMAAEIEARLDFPDEETPQIEWERLGDAMRGGHQQLNDLLRGFNAARLVRDGARVVIAGKPNAGKSSIFNALVGRERAIVTPHAGTTRDTIESTVEIAGMPVTLVDTAGIREARDEIERIGIERTDQELQIADLVIRVVDSQSAPESGMRNSAERELLLLNKSDLLNEDESNRWRNEVPDALLVSARTRTGIEVLEATIADRLRGGSHDEALQVANSRHAQCLIDSAAALDEARQALARQASGEFVMIDLRESILHLDELLGTRLDDQILDQIFRKFCMGK